jgi:hypothetical protein
LLHPLLWYALWCPSIARKTQFKNIYSIWMHTCIDNLRLFLSLSTIATTTDLGGSKGNYEHYLWIRVTVCLQFVYNSSCHLLLEVLRCLKCEMRTANGLMNIQYFWLVLKATSSKK